MAQDEPLAQNSGRSQPFLWGQPPFQFLTWFWDYDHFNTRFEYVSDGRPFFVVAGSGVKVKEEPPILGVDRLWIRAGVRMDPVWCLQSAHKKIPTKGGDIGIAPPAKCLEWSAHWPLRLSYACRLGVKA